MPIDQSTCVGLRELELCLGLKKSRIAELESEGVVAKNGVNEYRLIETLANYRNHLKRAVYETDDGKVIDFDKEKARKTKEEADRLQRINQVERGELIPVDEVKREISEAVGICARILGSLKLNIARVAPQVPNRALDLIGKEQSKMLTAIIELDESYAAKTIDN